MAENLTKFNGEKCTTSTTQEKTCGSSGLPRAEKADPKEIFSAKNTRI